MDAHAVMVVMLTAVRRTVARMTRVMKVGIDPATHMQEVSGMAVIMVSRVAVRAHALDGRTTGAIGGQPAAQAELDQQSHDYHEGLPHAKVKPTKRVATGTQLLNRTPAHSLPR